MEGAVEIFTGFIPNVSIIEGSGSQVKVSKRFSAGGLLAMLCYVLIGLALGAVV